MTKNLNIYRELSLIIDKIQELAIDIRSFDKENDNNEYDINKILRTSKQYEIKEHPLSNNDEHIKKVYISFLSSVMQYDGKSIKERLIFLSRIIQGCNFNVNLMDVIQYGMDMDNQLYDEFVVQVSKENLQYNFIVDALIISSCDSKINVKSIDYIAELASILNISNDDMKILCNIASIILMQNQEEFKKKFSLIESKLHYFICYLKEFVNGIICDNKKLFCFRSKKLMDFPIEHSINSEVIDITNANIHINEQEFKLCNAKSICMNDCNFILQTIETMKIEQELNSSPGFIKKDKIPQKLKDYLILVENCKNVKVNGLFFSTNGEEINIKENIFKINFCENVKLKNLQFNNIYMNHYEYALANKDNKSSYINLKNIESIEIEKLITKNCKLNSKQFADILGGIVFVENTKNSYIKESKFFNTDLIHKDFGNRTEVNGKNQGLIYGIQDIQNCESMNSANLTSLEISYV